MKEKIKQFINENFLFGESSEKLGDEDSLLEQGIIDSTGVLELVMYLEENHGIKVEDDELLPENLDSISSIAAFVDRKKAAFKDK